MRRVQRPVGRASRGVAHHAPHTASSGSSASGAEGAAPREGPHRRPVLPCPAVCGASALGTADNPTVSQPAPTVKHVVESVGNALETSGLVKVNGASTERGTNRKPLETRRFKKSKATATEFAEPCFQAVSRIRLAACRNSSNLPKPLVFKPFERARIRESLVFKGFRESARTTPRALGSLKPLENKGDSAASGFRKPCFQAL